MVDHAFGHGGMCDVFKEGMAIAHGLAGIHGVGQIALDQEELGLGWICGKGGVRHHQLRHAIGAGDKVAIGVGGQQRTIQHIAVIQLNAQQIGGLRLYIAPGGHAACVAMQQVAVGHGAAVCIEHIFAQEHLVRGMRGVGLVLVYPRRGFVHVLADVIRSAQDTIGARLVRGACQHHKVGGRAFDIKRVVGLQRDVDRAAATFADQVKPVVKELAKQRHPAVIGGRKPFVGGNIGQQYVVAIHFDAMGGQHGFQRSLCISRRGLRGGQGRRGGAGGINRRQGCSGIIQRGLQRALVVDRGLQIRRGGLCRGIGRGQRQGGSGHLGHGHTDFNAGRLRCVQRGLGGGHAVIGGGHGGIGIGDNAIQAGHFGISIGQAGVQRGQFALRGGHGIGCVGGGSLRPIHNSLLRAYRILGGKIGGRILLCGGQICLRGFQICPRQGQCVLVGGLLVQQGIDRGLRGIALAGQGGDQGICIGQRGLRINHGIIGIGIGGDGCGQRSGCIIGLGPLGRPVGRSCAHLCKIGSRVGQIGGKSVHKRGLRQRRLGGLGVVGGLCGIQRCLRLDCGLLCAVQRGLAGDNIGLGSGQVGIQRGQFALGRGQARIDVLHRQFSRRNSAQRRGNGSLCIGQAGGGGHAIQGGLQAVQLGLRSA